MLGSIMQYCAILVTNLYDQFSDCPNKSPLFTYHTPTQGPKIHKIHGAAISTSGRRICSSNMPVKTIGATVSMRDGPSVSSTHSWQFSQNGRNENDIQDFLSWQLLVDQAGTTFGDPGLCHSHRTGYILQLSCGINVDVIQYCMICKNMIKYG